MVFYKRTLVALILFLHGVMLAGTTGKIAGTIIQAKDGEALVGVNVAVVELGMGAATDGDGYFFITNVPPGRYTLQVSYIGYQTVDYQNVTVSVDQTTEVRIALQETALEVENAVTVIAERPLVQKDITSKRSVIDGSQIAEKLPVSNLNEVLAMQSGINRDEDGGIHIRGGRLGEVTYLVDGTYVRNPFDNSLGGNVDVDAIQEMEVISGTFNAEYGNALSGVVNIVTKEGSPNYEAKLQYESAQLNSSPYHQTDWQLQRASVQSLTAEQQDEFRDLVRDVNGQSAYRDFQLFDHPFTQNLTGAAMPGKLNASLSGPLPFLRNKAHFFIAGTFRNEESPMPYGFELDRVLSSKLTFNVMPTLKFQLNADWSNLWSQDYDHQYKYWQYFAASDPEIGSFPITRDLKTRFTGKITHTLSNATFYNLSLSRIYNAERNYVPGRSVVSDATTGELITSDYLTRGFYQGLDGSFQTGDVRYWRRTESTTLDFDGDIVSQMNRYNQVKAGVELRQHTIFRHRIGMPPRERLEFFERKPLEFAAYLQDKIEMSFLILNLGLRFDMFDPKDTYFDDPGRILQTVTSNGETSIITVDQEAVPVRYKFSPRIGLAHPISATTVFHFAYGQFFQIPRYYDLYRNNELEDILVNDPLIGNPGLEPEETTAFEAGIKQQLGEDYAIEITAYYKDIDNLISSFYYFSGRDYTVFVNADYGRVQGIDVTLDKRYSNFFAGALNYTFMIAQGNESDPLEGYTLYREDDAFLRPNRDFPLDFDQRHSLSLNLDMGLPGDFGPALGGFHPLGILSANVLLRAGSGLPYTPSSRDPDASIVPERNSARKPWTNQVDLRLNKRFALAGAQLNWYWRVENLFDHLNVLRVWTQTGDPWDAGPTSIQSKDRQANPENVDIRRTIRTGIIFRF